MAIVPKNRFVAFIDILGVSQYTRDEILSKKYTSALYKVVSHILKKEGFFVFEHIRDDHEIEVEVRRPADKNSKFTTISDALAISVPELSVANDVHGRNRPLQILSILETISHLQSSLAAVGLLSRGGLACGPLMHSRDLIVGYGLVKAYQIESKRAIFPRTVIDDEVIQILLKDVIPSKIFGFRSRIAHAVSRDIDGEYYVNYFGYQPISGGVLHQRDNLERILKEKDIALAKEVDDRILAKLRWFYQYVQESLDSYFDPTFYLQHNKGSEFQIRYPRVFENMHHMVENYKTYGYYKDPFGTK